MLSKAMPSKGDYYPLRKTMNDKLGRYGYHADPVIDFEVEVDVIEGMISDARCGLRNANEVAEEISRAMDFKVGGDERVVLAKNALRRMADDFRQEFETDVG